MPIVLTRATKQDARYKALGGAEHCSACRFYMPQGTCGRIIGPVSPEGWCRFYSREAVQRSHPGYAGVAVGAPPTADLNFMLTPGTLPPNVVFTRASVGTYFDVAGTIQTATANTPRWTYDPVTHALQGMLMETARTNLLLNSAALGTQSATVTAAATTLSFYGTGSIAYSGVATGTLVGVGAFPQRASVTFTPTAGSLTLTVTGSVLNAQLETGGFASSWVPTVGATVARAAEACSLTNAVLLGGTTDRTLAVEAWVQQAVSIAHMGSVDDATSGNVQRLFSPGSSSNIRLNIAVGGVQQVLGGDTNPGTRPLLVKAAAANGAVWNGAVNGVLMLATGGLSLQHGPLTTLHCGTAFNGTQQLDGAIRRVLYWPRALSQGELLQVTS